MKTTAEEIYLALDPTFFLRNASEEMPPQPEFAEQRLAIDPVLFHRTWNSHANPDEARELLPRYPGFGVPLQELARE